MAVLYSNSDPKYGSHLNLLTPVESGSGSALLVDSVAEQEPRAEEPKLKSSRSPEPKLRIAAPAILLSVTTDLKKLSRKNHGF